MPDVSKYRPDVKFWIIFVAIGLFSVLLARPQFGSKLETVKRKGSRGNYCFGHFKLYVSAGCTA